MSLSAGDKLGPYEILGLLGAGGMGEVYRAHDPRLKRDVAIKVSTTQFNERFEREAQAIAALNHSQICQLYDVGPNYLVMEYIEGGPLKGPLPVDQVLKYAIQICDALDAAHKKGITHRDLKPANVLATKTGIKLLDFGLAKRSTGPAATEPLMPDDATLVMALTGKHEIVGTLYYMSPEQLQAQSNGREVDSRSDIFSFGLVLYELLTGKRAFEGPSQASVIASIMERPAPSVAELAPAALDRVLKRCLEKDPDNRWQTARDLKAELEWIASAPQTAGAPAHAPATKSRSGWTAWSAAALFALAAAALAAIHFREKTPEALPVRFQLPGPDKGTVGPISISPDGRHLAFVVRGGQEPSRIWVRSLDTLQARVLPGTEGVANPLFWSPDSRFIGFTTSGKLRKVDVAGGPVQTVCDIPSSFRGAAWAPDGTIVFSFADQPMMWVPDAGGAPAPLAVLSPGPDRIVSPSFMPDGRHFFYARGARDKNALYLASLDAKPDQQRTTPLVSLDLRFAPVYAPSPDPGLGYVLFLRDDSLMALPFDVRRLEPAGPAIPVAEGIANSSAAPFTASASGVLAFRPAISAESESRLLWVDRQGKPLGQLGPAGPYGNVQLSQDGKLAIVDQLTKEGTHVWAVDTARGVFNRVNPGGSSDMSGQPSPDGRVAFTFGPDGAQGDIYVRPASGAGAPQLWVKSATVKHPSHWSADGRFLIFDDHTARKMDLFVVSMSGDAAAKRDPVPFLATEANETDAVFSPDGRWVAYSSDESGRYEVYVQGFVPGSVPAAGIGKWQISNAGGAKPYWRHDGKELYYIANDGKMMAVTVKSTATALGPGDAVSLFETHVRGYAPYAVAPDGRFLINSVTEAAGVASPITVVLNWTAGLKK